MTSYIVGAGQTLTGLVLATGDTVTVNSGGTINRTFNSGGTDTIDGGKGIGTTILAGGIENIENSGIARGTIVENNASVFVRGTAALSGAIIETGGTVVLTDVYTPTGATDLSGKPTENGTLIYGGVEDVGTQFAYGVGVATNDTIQAGGRQYVWGLARNTTINNGGEQDVDNKATGTVVNSGGTQVVTGGDGDFGVAIGTVLNTGASQIVSHGSTQGTVINQGATEDVAGGGFGLATASVINGGALILESTGNAPANAGGGIRFTGTGGVLDIGGTVTPATTITGFAATDRIDLQGFGYNSQASVSLAGNHVLTITGLAGGTATLVLDAKTSYAGMRFALSADGKGGTDLTVQPASAGKLALPDLSAVSATNAAEGDPLGLRASFTTGSLTTTPAASASAMTLPDVAGGSAHALSMLAAASAAQPMLLASQHQVTG